MVCTRTEDEPIVVTDEEADIPSWFRTSLAGPSEGEATPVIVTSVPPLKSIPGLRPGLTTSTAEIAMATRATMYQILRRATKGIDVRPE